MGANVVVDGTPSLILATAGQVGIYTRVGEEPNIEALSVTENGTYTADGDGFNPVVVAVEAEVEALSVSENGTYTASGDGYNPVTVNVQPDLETLSVTANGSYAPTGDGFSEVTVNVQPTLETLTATANGTYTPTGDGYSAVEVAIPTYDGSYTVTPTTTAQTLATSGKVMTGDVTVEGHEEPTLISKTITSNGGYSASDEGADGFSEVIVNVETGGYALKTVTVEIGENSITNAAKTAEYFIGLFQDLAMFKSITLQEAYTVNNQFVDYYFNEYYNVAARRYRNGSVVGVSWGASNYDCYLVEGTHYTIEYFAAT